MRHEELLPFALDGEAVASGRHADNVAPALMGGMTLIDPVATFVHCLCRRAGDWSCFTASGNQDRRVADRVPDTVPLADAVKQAAWLGRFVHELHEGRDWRRCMRLPTSCGATSWPIDARLGSLPNRGHEWVPALEASAEAVLPVLGVPQRRRCSSCGQALAALMDAEGIEHHLHLTSTTQGALLYHSLTDRSSHARLLTPWWKDWPRTGLYYADSIPARGLWLSDEDLNPGFGWR